MEVPIFDQVTADRKYNAACRGECVFTICNERAANGFLLCILHLTALPDPVWWPVYLRTGKWRPPRER